MSNFPPSPPPRRLGPLVDLVDDLIPEPSEPKPKGQTNRGRIATQAQEPITQTNPVREGAINENFLAEQLAAGATPTNLLPHAERCARRKRRPKVLDTRAAGPYKPNTPHTAEGKRIDSELGAEQWLAVYDAFAQTGVPATIAEMTELPLESVEHILNRGVLRLELPAIREHARALATVSQAITASEGIKDPTPLAEQALEMPAVQRAVTSRAVQESAAAQQCLDAAVKANQVFHVFVEKVLEKANAGLVDLPDTLKMSTLIQLQQALVANTQAIERAVKTSRLVRGETTDHLSVQVAVLLQGCSLEELEEAERTGAIPSRVLGRYQQQQGERIIDLPPSDEGPDRLPEEVRPRLLTAPAAPARDDDTEGGGPAAPPASPAPASEP